MDCIIFLLKKNLKKRKVTYKIDGSASVARVKVYMYNQRCIDEPSFVHYNLYPVRKSLKKLKIHKVSEPFLTQYKKNKLM